MNCQDVREAASVALLTRAPEPGVVSEHLADCAACREELAELSPLVGLLSLAPDVPASTPPDELSLQRLLATVRAERVPGRRRRIVAATAAAVLFIAMSAGWFAAARHTEPYAHTFSSLSDVTGVTATVDVVGQNAGSLLRIGVSGVAPGTTCRLVVHSADGTDANVLTWLADYRGAAVVSTSIATAPQRIASVLVVDAATSRTLVSVPVNS